MNMYLVKRALLFLCVVASITSLALLHSTDVANAEEVPCMVSVSCECGDSISCSGDELCYGNVELGGVLCDGLMVFCRVCLLA